MEKKTLFLHVGLHKTGTTTIQQNLMTYEQDLRLEGFCQPDRQGRTSPGHHRIARLIVDHGPLVFVDHILNIADFQNVIVSSETFTTLILLNRIWSDALVELMNQHFNVIPILMLRRQDYMMESVFSQQAKHEHKLDMQALPTYHYDYLKIVNVLENSFGRENVRIVVYRDDKRTDTWDTFCSILGLEADRYRSEGSTMNRSLHRRKNIALSKIELRNRSMGVAVMEAMGRSKAIRDDGEKFLFAPERREEILRKYSQGNREICDRFDIPQADADYLCATEVSKEWTAPADIDSDEWAGFVGDLVPYLRKLYTAPQADPDSPD